MKMLFVFAVLTVIAVCQPVLCNDSVFFENTPYVFGITAKLPVGIRLGRLQAHSMTGKAVRYSIVSGDSTYFDLDTTTGEIYVAQSLPKDVESLEFEAQAATTNAQARAHVSIYCIKI